MIHSFNSLWPELPVPDPVSSEAHALSLARSSVLSASPFNIPCSCTCQQKLSVPRGHDLPRNLLSGWLFSPALAPTRCSCSSFSRSSLLFSIWRIPTSLSTDQQTTENSLGQVSLSSFCLTFLFSFNKHVGSLVSTFPASLFTTSLLTHWVSITMRLSPPAFYWSCCCQSQPSWWLNAAKPNSQIEFLTLLYFLLYSTLLITPFSWNPFLTHLSGQ